MHPDELAKYPQPWVDTTVDGLNQREGKFGEIMPEDEFYMLMQCVDVFELVMLDKEFVAQVKDKFAANPVIDESIVARIHEGVDASEIEHFVNEEHAEPLVYGGKTIGFVKRAHAGEHGFQSICCSVPAAPDPCYRHRQKRDRLRYRLL